MPARPESYQSRPRPRHRLDPPSPAAFAEDEEKTAIHDRFEAQGYTVEIAWGRVRGMTGKAVRPATIDDVEPLADSPS